VGTVVTLKEVLPIIDVLKVETETVFVVGVFDDGFKTTTSKSVFDILFARGSSEVFILVFATIIDQRIRCFQSRLGYERMLGFQT
jgi:hypothetical protein